MAEWHPLPTLDDASTVPPEWIELNHAALHRAKHLSGDHSSANLPDLRNVTSQDFQHVYEPSDDTYLLMDAIKHEIHSGRWDSYCHDEVDQEKVDPARVSSSSSTPSLLVVLEIGCGSGVPSVVFRTEWYSRYGRGGDTDSKSSSSSGEAAPSGGAGIKRRPHNTHRNLISFATDVNPKALEVAHRIATSNPPPRGTNGVVEFIRCDLASSLLTRLEGQVDVLLFNPPYVPTPDDEVHGCGVEASWAGGARGRRVMDRFLPQLPQLLSKPKPEGDDISGVAYMITVDDNCPHELARKLKEEHGLCMVPWLRRRAFNEYLTVQKITWDK